MHQEILRKKPGRCPICQMLLVKTQEKSFAHANHLMKPLNKMSFWEKFKMGMTMTMGMDHTGKTGREMAKLMEEDIRNKFIFSLLLTIPIVAYSMGEAFFPLRFPTLLPKTWLLFLLTTPVYFYGGWLFLYSAFYELKTRKLGMSVLIAVGITAAYFFSLVFTLSGSQETFYEAAAMLITFVLFGHWMEMKSRRGTTDSLQALFNLVPTKTRILKHGKEQMILTIGVKVGDILILKPGDRVPVDGEIFSGETAIDESLVTGESIPVVKKKGDKVIAGTINQSGSVQFRAMKVGEDTALSHITKMVETAQNSKAPGQKMADKFAKYLVFLAVGGGILTFTVWYFIVGQPFFFALTFAISVVVIACPDALGLATPTAVAVGTGLGAKNHILIKDASTLEQLAKIQTIVLDKTGTLTKGKPKITDLVTIKGFSEDEALKLMSAAEMRSSHPLAKAILDEAKKRKLKIPIKINAFENLAGLGVKAVIDAKDILVGTPRLMKEKKVDITPLEKTLQKFLNNGETVMLLAVNGKIKAVAGATDPLKKNAEKAIMKLRERNIDVIMITGDNHKTAGIVAKKLGIKKVFAEVMPEDKASYIQKLQKGGKFTAMVGDGVNDAPALAQADIGIAVGAGTDVAIETANVILMKSDPVDILKAISLSKATVRKMKQNLFWASFYNLLAIPLAAGVLYPQYGFMLRPEVSALLMSASSIIVALNAVLLTRTEWELQKI